jgi:hypothetical protein
MTRPDDAIVDASRTSADARPGTSGAKQARPSLSKRRERLLDEIAVERVRMREAAYTVLGPVRKIDEVRTKMGGSRQWLYPAAPLLALLAFRLRPGWRSVPSLMARGWTVWRLWRRFH